MRELTRPDRYWLEALSKIDGMFNPYTVHKARGAWFRRMERLGRLGLVSHSEGNDYYLLRGGLYSITPAGRAALQQDPQP